MADKPEPYTTPIDPRYMEERERLLKAEAEGRPALLMEELPELPLSDAERESRLRRAIEVGPYPPIDDYGDDVAFLLRLLDEERAHAKVAAERYQSRTEALWDGSSPS